MAAVTTKSVRSTRKFDRPRPLRTTSSDSGLARMAPQTLDLANVKTSTGSADNILPELESLHIHINNANFDDSTVFLLVQVCNHLKSRGQQLDLICKEQLDRYFATLRNASRDERLDMHSRLRLLEIIELRAMKWKTNENLTNYYKQKIVEMEAPGYMSSVLSQSATVPYLVPAMLPQSPSQTSPFALSQGEVLRSSGKFSKPTKIPGKNFFKDEIIIRNSDSGKVSPGARDRLVQITGPNDESISQAKVLIDDTIRRNASPVREKADIGTFGILGSESSTSLNSSVSEESNGPQVAPKKPLMHSYSMGDATLGAYAYSVTVGTETIRISGSKVDLVQTAKLVLEEYFAGQAELTEKVSHETFATSNSFSAFEGNAFGSASKPPDYGLLTRQESFKFDKVPAEKVNHWLTRSNSSSASLGNRNVPLRSSSSEEETYKGEPGSPTTEDEKPPTKEAFIPYLPNTSPSIKTATLFFQPNQGNRMITTEANENKIVYTRDFLLDCALSPLCRVRPKDTAARSIEAASLFKESPKVFFEPNVYKEELKMTFWEKHDIFRRSPPQSQEN